MNTIVEQLDALAPLAAAATEGPWFIYSEVEGDETGPTGCTTMLVPQPGAAHDEQGNYNDIANVANGVDGEFLAAARDFLTPDTIAALRAATAASPNEVTPLDTLEPLTKDELEAAAFGLAMRTERVGFPSFTQYAYELASRAVQQLRAAASVTGSREGDAELAELFDKDGALLLPVNIKDLAEPSEAEKTELINKAVAAAGHCLLTAFFVCKIPNYITGAFSDGFGDEYELTFRRRASKVVPVMAAQIAAAAPVVESRPANYLPIYEGCPELPKQGERVVLLSHASQLAPVFGRLREDESGLYWQIEGESDGWAFTNFTHYLPLPARPTALETIHRAAPLTPKAS